MAELEEAAGVALPSEKLDETADEELLASAATSAGPVDCSLLPGAASAVSSATATCCCWIRIADCEFRAPVRPGCLSGRRRWGDEDKEIS